MTWKPILSKCRVKGASGFQHQIDVAVRSPVHVVLVECKYWKNPIDPEAVLAFAARCSDIKDACSGCRVEALFAATVGATSGAKVLAEYFAIDIGVVSSESEFALRVANLLRVGASEGVKVGDHAEARIV